MQAQIVKGMETWLTATHCAGPECSHRTQYQMRCPCRGDGGGGWILLWPGRKVITCPAEGNLKHKCSLV